MNQQQLEQKAKALLKAFSNRHGWVDGLWPSQYKALNDFKKELAGASWMQGEGERLRLKQELDEPDSIEALVVDYITMLELDALGELKEDGTLQDKGVSHVFSCLRRAKERSQERPFVLLADILRKRIYEPKPQTEQP